VVIVVESWYQNYTTNYSLLPIATPTGLYSTHHIQRVGSMLRLRVREVAQEKGISMSKLSRIADVNYKTIQTIWRDPYHGLNTITLNKIAQALEVPTSELIEDVPDA
jgi:DNA-binding Xre family transcriptional regulator